MKLPVHKNQLPLYHQVSMKVLCCLDTQGHCRVWRQIKKSQPQHQPQLWTQNQIRGSEVVRPMIMKPNYKGSESTDTDHSHDEKSTEKT